MSKTVKIALIVAGALVCTGMVFYCIAFAFGARFEKVWSGELLPEPYFVNIGTVRNPEYRDWDNAYASDGAYSVSANGLNSMDIKWVAGNVEINVYDGSEVLIQETAKVSIPEEKALRYGVENGMLYIQYCDKVTKANQIEKDLTVSIPRALAEDMNSFNFDAASASLSLSGITAEYFTFDSVSGRLEAASMLMDTVELNATSGSVHFSGEYGRLDADSVSGEVTVESKKTAVSTSINTTSGSVTLSGSCGELSIDTVSGRISSAEAVMAQTLKINSTSGDVSLNGSIGSVDVNAVSGAVTLRSDICPAEISIGTASGDVSVTLPKDSGFTLKYDTASGKLDCGFSVRMDGDHYISGNGAATFNVDTVSGSLSVYEQ